MPVNRQVELVNRWKQVEACDNKLKVQQMKIFLILFLLYFIILFINLSPDDAAAVPGAGGGVRSALAAPGEGTDRPQTEPRQVGNMASTLFLFFQLSVSFK